MPSRPITEIALLFVENVPLPEWLLVLIQFTSIISVLVDGKQPTPG
jgi:hypothetical protein